MKVGDVRQTRHEGLLLLLLRRVGFCAELELPVWEVLDIESGEMYTVSNWYLDRETNDWEFYAHA